MIFINFKIKYYIQYEYAQINLTMNSKQQHTIIKYIIFGKYCTSKTFQDFDNVYF